MSIQVNVYIIYYGSHLLLAIDILNVDTEYDIRIVLLHLKGALQCMNEYVIDKKLENVMKVIL